MHFSASAKYKNCALNSNDPDVDISKHKHIMFKDKKITFVKNFRLLGFIIDNQLCNLNLLNFIIKFNKNMLK